MPRKNKPEKKLPFLKKHLHLLVVLALCLFVFISHVFYVMDTHQYPQWDEHTYLDLAVNYLDMFQGHSTVNLAHIMDFSQSRQPLFPLAITLPLLLLGTAYTYKIALIVNGLFYIVTIAAVYFLAKQFVNKTTSIMASLLFACYGFPLFYLHFTYTETAVTTFIVLSLLFLKKSENFTIYRYTLLTGLFFLLANLTRWVTPVFFAGPAAYCLIAGISMQWNKKTRNIKQFLTGLGIFVLIGIVLPLVIYYLPNAQVFLEYMQSSTSNAPRWVAQFIAPELQNPFSTRSIMYYFNILSQQTVFLFLLFLAGFFISVFRFKKYGFLLAAFLFPYCFFTFITVLKDDRFIVPIYPAMAIISSLVFVHIRNVYLKNALVVVVTCLALMSFFAGSWGLGPMGFQGLKDIVLPSFIHHPRRIYLTPMVWPPRKEESNAYQIFQYIERDWKHKERRPIALGAFSYGPVDNAGYTILKYEKRHLLTSTTLTSVTRDDYKTLFTLFNNADYVYTKDRNAIQANLVNLEEWYMIGQFVQAMQLPQAHLPGAFVKGRVISVPIDNSHVTIYKKIRPITPAEFWEFADLFVQLHPEKQAIINNAVTEVTQSLQQ